MTRPLDIDFRRRPSSVWRWAGWALLVASAAAAAFVADRYQAASTALDVAESHAREADKRLRDARPMRSSLPLEPRLAAQIQRANRIVDELTVPWDALFDAVEAADGKSLGLLSLTPDARDRSLRIAGEARTPADVLAYVQRLAEQPALGRVHLQGFATATRDGLAVTSFTVAASWRTEP